MPTVVTGMIHEYNEGSYAGGKTFIVSVYRKYLS